MELPYSQNSIKGVEEGWSGRLGLADATVIYRMDKQQGPTV